jgi:hypothetical protein
MGLEDAFLLLRTDWVFFNVWVQVIMPSREKTSYESRIKEFYLGIK